MGTITRRHIRDELLFVTILVLLVLALPLAAALAFATRLAFLAGLVAVAVGAIVFAVSPVFRSWFTGWAEGKVSFSGIRLAHDVALAESHGWTRVEGGELVVGADDLVQTALGPVDKIDLPPPGTRIRRGEPLFRLHRGDRTVAIRSPVTGTVSGANPRLANDPSLINEAPFTAGWAVRLEAEGESPRRQRRSLLQGRQAKAWMRDEVDRLLAVLVGTPGGVPCLPDGGVLVDEVYRHIDDDTWRRVNASFFEIEPTAESR
jgi:glycine cleavage system H protein